MKRRKRGGVYHSLVTFPDHCYPFGCKIRGQWVRGIRSYNRALAKAFRKNGFGHYGYGLMFYRQLFHFAGSLLFMIVATLIAQDLFGSNIALFVLFGIATLLISFQEFYLQRWQYRQLWRKAIADWIVWVAPLGVYIFIHLH